MPNINTTINPPLLDRHNRPLPAARRYEGAAISQHTTMKKKHFSWWWWCVGFFVIFLITFDLNRDITIIVIVAAGLIFATVIMLVLEKRKEIAVLKALGVSDGGIVKIFLAEGLQIGIAGGVLGLVSGLAWCLFIEKVGIKLDPQVYYIPALPVRIVPLQTMLAVVIAILVTFLASVYPALKASQVEPVEGLKSE